MSRRTRRARSQDWLTVLDVDGPFLAAPVVTEVFPAGLPNLEADAVRAVREVNAALDAGIGQRDPFIRHVLREFLGWGDQLLDGSHLPPGRDVRAPDPHVTTRPPSPPAPLEDDEPDPPGPPRPLLLGMVLPAGAQANRRL